MEIWETVAADLNAGNGDIIRFVAVTIPGGEDRGLALIDNLKVYPLLTARYSPLLCLFAAFFVRCMTKNAKLFPIYLRRNFLRLEMFPTREKNFCCKLEDFLDVRNFFHSNIT